MKNFVVLLLGFFLVGCSYELQGLNAFKYQDEVVVVEGFYKGRIGKVVKERFYDDMFERYMSFTVEFDEGMLVEFRSEQLKKQGEE